MKDQDAVDYLRKGFNCAQSVLTVFAKEKGIPEVQALKIAGGFGAGMGRLEQTCGAVTGAYMALGLHYGKSIGDTDEQRDTMYALVRKFDASFRDKFATTCCRELINCDLLTEEGRKYYHENAVNEKVCARCVRESVKIVEQLLAEAV